MVYVSQPSFNPLVPPLSSNNPKGRVPRACPWGNENSPVGRQAKLAIKKCHGLARGYLHCHCEPFSEVSREKARQSALLSDSLAPPRDCFVALLLAMTTRPSWDTGSRHAILIAGDKAAAVGFCS